VNEVADASSGFTSSGGTRGTKLGATIGGGTDLFLGRHFTLTLDGRYLVLGHRSPYPSLEGRQLSINVPGRFAVRLGFGLTFGGGRP
jgi:hypothetical protein